MLIILFLLGIANIFMAGCIWGAIESLKRLDVYPNAKQYMAIVLCLLAGFFCLICVIGKGCI